MKIVRRLLLLFLVIIFSLVAVLRYQPQPKRNKPTVAVILGYHFLLEKDSAERNYVRQIKNILESFPGLKFIIVSGAKTKPESSHYSEAKNIEVELRRQGIMAPVILEESAWSTKQNIEFSDEALRSIQSSLPSSTQVIIFSDKLRRPAVWWHARDHFQNFSTFVFGIPLWHERLAYAWETRVLHYRDKYDKHNFAAVEEGKLYRSAQPSAKYLRLLKNNYGVKTVINLRGETLGSEKIAAERLGLHLFEIPISTNQPPEEVDVEKFLNIVNNPDYQPVLVHCRAGSDRTGIMIANYRVKAQGWSNDRALQEMEQFGYKRFLHPQLVKSLDKGGD